jgi:hypothetical protein
MQTQRLKLSDLRSPDRNVRFHPEEQVAELARAVTMFGQTRPIVIDENNTILAGNGLVMALMRLGHKDGDTYRVTGLSPEQKSKLMLSDNRIWQLGLNDQDAIMEMIRSLDGDIDIPGFTPISLDFGQMTLPGASADGAAEPQDAAAAGESAAPSAAASLTCPHCQHQFARP